MKIIFCHHAQRKRDKTAPRELWQNEGITELGEKDAALYAKMLNGCNLKISAIYSSPFFRCMKTAEIVNQFSNAPIIKEERFNEFGSVDGETWAECQQRIINAIKDITKKHNQDDVVLCVTSGVNLTGFICWAYGIEPSEKNLFPWLISCSPIIFDYDKNRGTCLADVPSYFKK